MNAPPAVRAVNCRERGMDLLNEIRNSNAIGRCFACQETGAHDINRFNFPIEYFSWSQRSEGKGFTNNQGEDRRFSGNARYRAHDRLTAPTSPPAPPPPTKMSKPAARTWCFAPSPPSTGP